MTRSTTIRLALMLILLQGVKTVRSEDGVAEKRRYVAAGMRAEREKLRSGQVEMRGLHSKITAAYPEYRVPVRFLYEFDHDRLRYRHETRDYMPMTVNLIQSKLMAEAKANLDLPRGVNAKGEDWVSYEIGGGVVNTPEYTLFRSCGATKIDRLPPGTAGKTAVREMDVRTFGLSDWHTFVTGVPLDKCVDAFEGIYGGPSVESEGNGISRFRFNLVEGELMWEMWVDELRGMTPIRTVRTELTDGHWESSRSEVTWEPMGGTWVPKTFMIRSDYRAGSTTELALTLDWKSVNEPIDPKRFTAAGLVESHDEITLVADTTLGKVVIEPVNPLPVRLFQPKATPPQPPSWFGWIVLGHLIAGGGFAWWYYRRKSRRQSA